MVEKYMAFKFYSEIFGIVVALLFIIGYFLYVIWSNKHGK